MIMPTSYQLDYLADKLIDAPMLMEPFPHVEIRNFFEDEHFEELRRCPQIAIPLSPTVESLLSTLTQFGYDPIDFPGTTRDPAAYAKWFNDPKTKHTNNDTCEGMGMAYRLQRIAYPILRACNAFFASSRWLGPASRKFGITGTSTFQGGLHKYLSGYEISPHPDVRRKALTYMVNLETDSRLNYDTRLLRFKPEWLFVEDYWRNNAELIDRCWVPWSWCEEVKRQTEPNSLVMFSPSNNTLHAVRAHYDHSRAQRTQFYGNLWYEGEFPHYKPRWRDLETLKPCLESK
jgi:hypothetical protein